MRISVLVVSLTLTLTACKGGTKTLSEALPMSAPPAASSLLEETGASSLRALKVRIDVSVDEWLAIDYVVLESGRYRYVSDGTVDGDKSLYTICEGTIDAKVVADAIDKAQRLSLVEYEKSCVKRRECQWYYDAQDEFRFYWPELSTPSADGRVAMVADEKKAYEAFVEAIKPTIEAVEENRETKDCEERTGP